MITMIVFVRRKAGLTPEEFSDYWLHQHAPLVKSAPEFMRYVRKYVQHHPAPPETGGASPFGDTQDYDGVGEIWFDSREAMTAAFAEPRYLEIIRPDEEKFFDAAGCLAFIASEYIMFDERAGDVVAAIPAPHS